MKSKKSIKSTGSKKSLRKKVLKSQKQQDYEEITIEDNSQILQNQQMINNDDFGDENIPNENDFIEFEEFINENEKILCDKSTAPSPTHSIISSAASYNSNWARERELENTNENLQEKLKDTEERLQSLRIQYDSITQAHRKLRETHSQIHEENDKLKIDFQILTECAHTLR